MGQQQVLFSVQHEDDDARARIDALISPALRRAFPLPREGDERFGRLLDALAGRMPPPGDRHA